ncbi:MAG: cytochrome P450, partial [Opitutae bacterium]|nr:cytochrome P450 [Opitutae bacterium]
MPQHQDSFEEARVTSGIQFTEFNGECIPFILRLKELRKTAKNWKEFSSDNPFQVVPHSEEGLRSMRQIPIEM